jgi:hypothetical protein
MTVVLQYGHRIEAALLSGGSSGAEQDGHLSASVMAVVFFALTC